MKKIIIAIILLIAISCKKKNEVNLKLSFLANSDYTVSINDEPEINGKDLTNSSKTIIWDLNKKIKVHMKGLHASYNDLSIYFIYLNKTYIVRNRDVNGKVIGDVLDFNDKLH